MRRMLYSRGYRYRIHCKEFPGTPDVVLAARRSAIFVHGCFWHGHGCPGTKVPATRRGYWVAKIAANRKRDRRCLKVLSKTGWRVLVVWACELRDPDHVARVLVEFLGQPNTKAVTSKFKSEHY